VQWVPGVSRG